jgi:hypothetical protein
MRAVRLNGRGLVPRKCPDFAWLDRHHVPGNKLWIGPARLQVYARDSTPLRERPEAGFSVSAAASRVGRFLTTKTGPILESASSYAGCCGKEAVGYLVGQGALRRSREAPMVIP